MVINFNQSPRSRAARYEWLLETLKQGWRSMMDRLIVETLIFDIIADHFFIAILTDGIDVVATRPELPAPQQPFDCGVTFENLLRCDTFRNLGQTAGRQCWYTLD